MSLAGLLDEVALVMRPLLGAKETVWETDCPPGLLARADRQGLVQVLLNLASNAVKFTGRAGRVSLSCLPADDGAVRIDVEDDGPGIAREDLERIFEPFVRVGARPGREGGAGLGLSISRDLVRRMEGALTVESTPGSGSTFTVWLPGAQPSAPDPTDPFDRQPQREGAADAELAPH